MVCGPSGRGLQRLLLSSAVIILLLGVVAAVDTRVASAQATGGNCINYGNNHAGYVHTVPQAVIGTLVDITVRNGSLCQGGTSNNNASLSFTMIQELGYNFGYAQVGYVRFINESRRHFAEFNVDTFANPSGFTRVFGGSASTGTTHGYWVYYNSNCSCLEMYVGFSRLAFTGFNPFLEWTGVGGFWASETLWDESNIPGSAITYNTHGDLRVQPFFSASYAQNSAQLSPINGLPSRYSLSAIAYNSFNSWTR